MKAATVFIGSLDAVRRYPVKSLRGDALDAVEVDRSGIPGDRSRAFFVRSGNPRVGNTYRGKEHERLHLIAEVETALSAASARGVDVELRGGEHFFDDAPISILVDRWLEGLSGGLGYAVEWERFRPNFFVRAADGYAQTEEALVDEILQLGTVTLRVRCPIERCVTITYHPQGEPPDPRILGFLAQHRNAWMGIYCDVLEAGIARVGDSLVRL
jgi:uncharacterized protein